MDGVAVLSYVDVTGGPDDLRVASPAKHTITLLGPTVVAGAGCVPVPGGASCTHPDLTDLWEIVSIQVGGGDDTVTVEAPQQMVIAGDMVIGAPDSGACWQLARSLGCPLLRGNHERYLFDFGSV